MSSSDDMDADVEAPWLEEAKRRLASVRSGRMKTVPAQEVERRLWEMLERARCR